MNIFKKIYQLLFVPTVEEVQEECKPVYTMEGVKEDFPPEIQRRNEKFVYKKSDSSTTPANVVSEGEFLALLKESQKGEVNEVKADEIKAKRKRPYKKKNKNK